MHRTLSPRVHGPMDYAAVALLALAPTLFGFGGIAAYLCYFLAATQFVMSLLTAYPWGALKIIPFTAHGMVELATAIFLIAAPFLFGFADVPSARNFFLVAGVGLGVVWALTNYRAAERPTGIHVPQRRTV